MKPANVIFKPPGGIGTLPLKKVLSVALLVFTLILDARSSPDVVLLDFKTAGRKWDFLGLNGNEKSNGVFPRQVLMDINSDGIVYGFVCEYKESDEIFGVLKTNIQNLLGGEPKLSNEGFTAWRDEKLKLTISLFRDRDTKAIKVAVVSVDKSVRRD